MKEWEAYKLRFAYERATAGRVPRARFEVVQLCDPRTGPTDSYIVEYWEEEEGGWRFPDGLCYRHKARPPLQE